MPGQDNVPHASDDEFGQLDDIDWGNIPDEMWSNGDAWNGRPEVQGTGAADEQPVASTSYTPQSDIHSRSASRGSSVGNLLDDPVDEQFLAQLDAVEQHLVNDEHLSCEPGPLRYITTPTRHPPSPPAMKRNLSNETSRTNAPTKKKKSCSRRSPSLEIVEPPLPSDTLEKYGDELNCPICYDLLIAAHSTNPCGHTVCGPCGYEWTTKMGRLGCPVCRTSLYRPMPIIPNVAMDNVVDKHVSILGGRDRSWRLGGKEYSSRAQRYKKWRLEAEIRATEKRNLRAPARVYDSGRGHAHSANSRQPLGHFPRAHSNSPRHGAREPSPYSDDEDDIRAVRQVFGNRTLVRHFRVLQDMERESSQDDDDDDGTFEVEEDEDYVESEWLVTEG